MHRSLGIGISLVLACLPVQMLLVCVSTSAQTTSDRKAEADKLLEQGIAQRRISEYRNAIQLDLKALNVCREIKDLNCEGRALSGLGIAYQSLGQYQKAIDYHLGCQLMLLER